MRDAWREVLTNIKDDLNIEFICKVNSFVSRNESLKWCVLRDGNVGISGTNHITDIPVYETVKEELLNILNIKEVTLRAIKFMLYGMRKQLFWDGNKRTSMIVANKIMIQNGKGIITVKENKLLEFNTLLTNYYDTGEDEKLIKFIYDNCIFGLETIN